MVLLNQYLSLLNATYLTFQFQCCDTYCTFPGETCDRSRAEFCVCKACFCQNDSTFLQEEARECRAHCSIERFRKYALEDDEKADDKDNIPETTEESQDCVLITTLGIASFCGNVIGLIICIGLGIRYCHHDCSLKRHNKHTQKQAEIESFIGRKDSGINDESGDESGVGTTLDEQFKSLCRNFTEEIQPINSNSYAYFFYGSITLNVVLLLLTMCLVIRFVQMKQQKHTSSKEKESENQVKKPGITSSMYLNSEEKTLNTMHPTEDSGKLLLSSSHNSYDLESQQCSCCSSATSTSTEPKSV